MGMMRSREPFLNWHLRMGKHEAVHQNGINRIIHWTCIPCQIFSACLLFSNVDIMKYTFLTMGDTIMIPFNLSLVVICSIVILYYLLDELGALFTAIVWSPLLVGANVIHQHSLLGEYEIIFSLLFFISTFSIQVGVGHVVFEEGRDDTEQNISEFFETWNPVYISCIPFYHHMEIIFNMGLKSHIYKNVIKHQNAASAALIKKE